MSFLRINTNSNGILDESKRPKTNNNKQQQQQQTTTTTILYLAEENFDKIIKPQI